MKTDKGLVFLVCVVLFVTLYGVGIRQLKSNGLSPKEVLLETCTSHINKLTNEDISYISPRMVITSGGGAYGYDQLLIYWQSDEDNLDITCLGRGAFDPRTSGIIEKLIVNDEDLTNLVRREERKE